MTSKKLSRRGFLGTALATSTIGFTGIAKAQSNQTQNEKWDKEADVVVLGCGAAGLMSALQAHDGGAKVLIYDKGLSPYQTSTRLNGGLFSACNSRRQKEKGIKDSPENFAQNLMDYGLGLCAAAPVNTFAKNSGQCFDWLEDHGLAAHDLDPYPGHNVLRSIRQKSFSGVDYIDCLTKQLKDRGLTINHDMPLYRIIYDKENNRVLGVECGHEGKTEKIKANKGVVLATGGLTGSTKSVDKWNPLYTASVPIGGPSNDGQAMMIAVRDVGLPLTHMQYFAAYPQAIACGPRRGPMLRFQYLVANGAVLVNKDGNRFVKETEGNTQITPLMLKNPDGCMYVLMNDEIFEKTAKERPFGALVSLPQWDRARWDKEIARGKTIVRADTLDELADKLGINKEGLKKQIQAWNGYCSEQKDPQFGRTKFGIPLDKGPYIAAKTNIWICLSHGGFRVNEKLQPLNWEDKPVEGLYAAGETVGGVHGGAYLGGDACGFAHTSGYVAGRLLTGKEVAL